MEASSKRKVFREATQEEFEDFCEKMDFDRRALRVFVSANELGTIDGFIALPTKWQLEQWGVDGFKLPEANTKTERFGDGQRDRVWEAEIKTDVINPFRTGVRRMDCSRPNYKGLE